MRFHLDFAQARLAAAVNRLALQPRVDIGEPRPRLQGSSINSGYTIKKTIFSPISLTMLSNSMQNKA